jgi:hypothetical protein
MGDNVLGVSRETLKDFNRYCSDLAKTAAADRAFRSVAGGIAEKLQVGSPEFERMMRCREWLCHATSEEFRGYSPLEAIESVAVADDQGLLAFADREDSTSRSILRIMGLALLLNKAASNEVFVSAAGPVASGKTTLICNLTGLDGEHLTSDKSGQTVVNLLVAEGSKEKVVVMPLTGMMTGRDDDKSAAWGTTAAQATAELVRRINQTTPMARIQGDNIPLSAAMSYLARDEFASGGIACLKGEAPSSRGMWEKMRVPGASITFLDARGFNTMAAAETEKTGKLFSQGAEVALLLFRLQARWNPDGKPEDSGYPYDRHPAFGQNEKAYLTKMVEVWGDRLPKRLIVAFTYLNDMVSPNEQQDSVSIKQMVQRTSRFMADTIHDVRTVMEQLGMGAHADEVSYLLLDNVDKPLSIEHRRELWQCLPEKVRQTYGDETRFADWFVSDSGLSGVCGMIEKTIADRVVVQRRNEMEQLQQGLCNQAEAPLHQMFDDTFPHLVEDCGDIFRDKRFTEMQRGDFDAHLDTQQVDGTAEKLMEHIRHLGAIGAYEALMGYRLNGVRDLLKLTSAEEFLVKEFFLGTATGFASFLKRRSDTDSLPTDDAIKEMVIGAFLDILEDIRYGDGQGTKEYLKKSLRDATSLAREKFQEYRPLVDNLGV